MRVARFGNRSMTRTGLLPSVRWLVCRVCTLHQPLFMTSHVSLVYLPSPRRSRPPTLGQCTLLSNEVSTWCRRIWAILRTNRSLRWSVDTETADKTAGHRRYRLTLCVQTPRRRRTQHRYVKYRQRNQNQSLKFPLTQPGRPRRPR